ncbi:hypothetical protein [Shimia sp.]|uniref:hypothetical protein n=1 Tax=Shimia sp. TaxID=1954381 RepID=UPI00356B25F3
MQKVNKSDNFNELGEDFAARAETVIMRGLRATPEGLLCCLQWSAPGADPEGARHGLRVVLRRADGGEETVFDHSEAGLGEAGLAMGNATLFGLCDRDLGAVVVNGLETTRIEAIDPGLAPAAGALSAACQGYVSALAAQDGTLAVLEEYVADEELCQRLSWAGGDGAVRRADLAALELRAGRMISGLVFWQGRLCLLVADVRAGADVVALDLAEASPAPQPLLARGAHRFALDAAYAAACPTGAGLLLGSAALNDSSVMLGNWGGEMLLLMPEGWDLLVGQPRFSPDGLKVPASMQGPGFDAAVNCAVQAIAAPADAEGGPVYALVQDFAGETIDDRAAIIADFREYRGRARLFVSRDLGEWSAVEMALPVTCGAVTSLAVTPEGLAVGHEGPGRAGLPLTLVAVAA